MRAIAHVEEPYRNMCAVTGSQPTIYLVDDDEGIRMCISELLTMRGFTCMVYSSGQELLDDISAIVDGCLIVDFRLPDMSGLDLIRQFREQGGTLPFLLISGCATIAIAVDAMKLGAVNIIEKPFEVQQFLDKVQALLAESVRIRAEATKAASLEEALDDDPRQLLTPRERQVMDLVVRGHLTKNIAKTLNISSKTVEVHRSNITKKFRVDSVAQLIGRVLTLDPQFLTRNRQEPAEVEDRGR